MVIAAGVVSENPSGDSVTGPSLPKTRDEDIERKLRLYGIFQAFRNGSLHLTNIYWFGRKIPIQQANQCGSYQRSWVQHAYQPEQEIKFGRSSTRQRFARRHRFRQVSLVEEELQRRATELFVPYHRSIRRTQGQRSDQQRHSKRA